MVLANRSGVNVTCQEFGGFVSRRHFTTKLYGTNIFQKRFILNLPIVFLLFLLSLTGCFPAETALAEKQTNEKVTKPQATAAKVQNTTATASPTVTKAVSEKPKVLFEGKITLFARINETEAASFIDLDKGQTGLGDQTRGDLIFNVSMGSDVYYLVQPVNGAAQYKTDDDVIDFDTCSQNLHSYRETNVPDFFDGTMLCVLTNEGRIAAVQYQGDPLHVGYLGQTSILLFVTVWEPVITTGN